MLGLPGLRIFEAAAADIAGLCEEHGHWVLRVGGQGSTIVVVPLPSAADRAIDRAIGPRTRCRRLGERRRRDCRDCCEYGWLTLTPAAERRVKAMVLLTAPVASASGQRDVGCAAAGGA
jgi:hypothetical protein